MKYLALIVLCCIALTGSAQTPTENTLLWEISGPGVRKSSFLFGTIHVMPRDSFYIPASLERIIPQTEQLVLEIPVDLKPADMMAVLSGMMMPKGQELQTLMPDSSYRAFVQFVTDSLDQHIKTYSRLKPIYSSQQISLKYCMDGQTESYEMYLNKRYKKDKKEVSGLETLQEQLRMLDEIPMEDQVAGLAEIAYAPHEMCDQFAELVSAYRNQDLTRLATLMEEEDGENWEQTKTTLLDDRNQKWISLISELIRKNTVLIAVGAGHLGGEYGVVNLLRQAGYEVKPVF
ncbi:MAG: TraB/GumN family protein [Bacteroidia bacterium]|nr:TraB/GumN family protein [Bacteroidia bacterium]